MSDYSRRDNSIFLDEEEHHSLSPSRSPQPPRFIPPHLTGEVMPGDDTSGLSDGSSPSTASNPDLDSMRSSYAARSSSPAKRSASERDGDEMGTGNPMDVDTLQRQVRSPKKNASHTSSLPSRIKSMSSSEESPTDEANPQQGNASSAHSRCLPSFDEQSRIVKELTNNTQLTEGTKGYIISTQWLTRVLARTTQGLNEGYPKDAREGPVGPLDNTDIAITSGVGDLKDEAGNIFIPLNPEMRMHNDFEIIPLQAWDLIKRWHGIAEGSPVITRYVQNTSDRGANQQNLMYEIHPPMVTIQKLRNDSEGMSQETLRDRDRPAVRLVASRHDQYQEFLKRAKTAAGISMTNKVHVWKMLHTSSPAEFEPAVPTPVVSTESSATSADGELSAAPKLVIDFATFSSMGEGTKRELLNFKDETTNEKYNGHANLAVVGFSETESLILEEQVRAEGDGQYVSDKIRKTAKQNGVELSSTKDTKLTADEKVKSKANDGKSRISPISTGMATRGRSHRNGRTKGTVGFQNLGNTCYMNSALQCIRSIEELTVYFLAEQYKSEINSDNPLGYNGSMAKVYASLVHSVYESLQSFSPRQFKSQLGRCQPLFSSYGQQDSQEFLSFLVDALHEDLNRIHKKPYIENPDSDDKTVHDPEAIKQLGETYRTNHRARNDSIATDLFTGFYKNTMVCPVCDKVSVTFDPYSSLTLQLPIETTWQHLVTVWPLRGPPVNVQIDTDKNSNIRMVKEYVAKRVKGVKPEALVVAEVYNEKFYKIFEESSIISECNIQQNDRIDIYELDETPTNWPPLHKGKPRKTIYSSKNDEIPSMESPVADRIAIPVFHRKKASESRSPLALYPSFILITRDEAKDYDSILRKVLQKVGTITTKNIFDTQNVESQNVELDTVIMTEEDIAEDVQIHAQSVEGEDGLVDISMTDRSDKAIDGHKPQPPNIAMTMRNSILNPDYFLRPELTTLFDMRVISTTADTIPLGHSDLTESSRPHLLASRLTQQLDERRLSTGSQRRRSSAVGRVSPVSSEDELNQLPDLTHDGFQHNEAPPSDSDSDGSRTSDVRRSRPGIASTYARIKKRGVDFVNRRRNKKQSDSESSKNDYLLRLGDGLVLDWNEEGYDQLFGGDAHDNFRGQFVLDTITTVQDPDLEAKNARRSARKQHGVSIEECFRETTKEEILSEENAWYCGRCKELRRASKTLEIWTVPDILVLHLKRFSTNSRLRDKIDVLVDFPISDLDLTEKVGLTEDKSLHYDLFAVDNHYGGLGGGHYTAVAQNFYDKKWYDYNDSSVSEVRPEEAVTKAAYLLFYRRRSTSPLGPPYLQKLVEDHYAPGSDSAGEAQRPDDSASHNGSSSNSPPAAVGARHPHGSPAGRGLESPVPSVNRGLILPGYESDESIGMGMDDDPPSYDFSGFGPTNRRPSHPEDLQPSWGWDGIALGALGRRGSDNDMADSDTLNDAASDAPAFGSESGQNRIAEDFADDSKFNSRAPPTPDSEEDRVRFLEHVPEREQGNSDDEVAEVRIDEEEGA